MNMRYTDHTHGTRSLACGLILLLCVTFPAAAGILFDARLDHWTEYQSESVDTADLNGDGIEDLVVLTEGYATVKLGRGDGTFDDEAKHWVGGTSFSLFTGDLDLDGDPDVAVVYTHTYGSPPDGGVAVLLGNGDGTLADQVKYPAGDNSRSAVVGDFNEDGRPDLAVACSGESSDPGGIAVLLGRGDGTFEDAVQFSGGTEPYWICTTDFDGDGNADLAATNVESNEVSVLTGNGDGTFGSAVQFACGEAPRSIAAHDLNADGNPDLATANNESGNVSVLLGNGDGTFQPLQAYPAVYSPLTIYIEDLDRDGIPDLTGVGFGDSGIFVLLGEGDGTFLPPTDYQVGNVARASATCDVNGDGIVDVVTANSGSFAEYIASVSVLLGTGDGGFRVPSGFGTGNQPMLIAAADLNRDGYHDLAASFAAFDPPGERGISILLGDGSGGFLSSANIAGGVNAYVLAMGNLDQDGNPDLVTSDLDTDRVLVLFGNGDGTFRAPADYPANDSVSDIAIGEMNGDGYPDLVVANGGSSEVSVLLGDGTGDFSAPVISPAGNGPVDISIGDLNRDEIPDLIVVNAGSQTFTVLLGNGDGTFLDGVDYGSAGTPVTATIGDLDVDGNPDVAVVNNSSHDISVRLGVGDGTFGQTTRYDVDSYPGSIAIGRIGFDDYPDIVVVNTLGNNISVLEGIGDGTFRAPQNFGADHRPEDVLIEDFDGDSYPDLAVANRDSNNVSILFNIARSDRLVVVGPGPALSNPPLVRGFPPRQDATHIVDFPAYGPDRYGVKVSCGDVTGDGGAEILTGAGPGDIYGPHVRGFRMDGVPLPGLSFFAYGTLKFGVNVAAGDLDGDGYDEVITGAGPGEVFGPHVRAFDYDGTPGVEPLPGVSYFAYGTPKWGVNVSGGDIDGDGYDEIVTGAGPGAVYGPHVRGWDVDGGAAAAIPGVSFFAYGTNKFGVNVSCGDLDGDGMDEIVTGAGPGAVFGPHVRGWNFDGTALSSISGINFFAWDPSSVRFGARVYAGADLDLDGRNELVVGGGPDPTSGTEVKVLKYDGFEISTWCSFEAFPGMSHGADVAAGRP